MRHYQLLHRYTDKQDTPQTEEVILTTSDVSEDLDIYLDHNNMEYIKELSDLEFDKSSADYYTQFGLN